MAAVQPEAWLRALITTTNNNCEIIKSAQNPNITERIKRIKTIVSVGRNKNYQHN
jgi:hypothetical protein